MASRPPYFPANVTVCVENTRGLIILDDKSNTLYTCDLRWLADKALKGEAMSRAERAAAGAALGHLIAIHKAVA